MTDTPQFPKQISSLSGLNMGSTVQTLKRAAYAGFVSSRFSLDVRGCPKESYVKGPLYR